MKDAIDAKAIEDESIEPLLSVPRGINVTSGDSRGTN